MTHLKLSPLILSLFAASAVQAELSSATAKDAFEAIEVYHCEDIETGDDVHWVLERLDDGNLRDPLQNVTSVKTGSDLVFKISKNEFKTFSENRMSYVKDGQFTEFACSEITPQIDEAAAEIIKLKARDHGMSLDEYLSHTGGEVTKAMHQKISDQSTQIYQLFKELHEKDQEIESLKNALRSSYIQLN